MSDIDKAMLPGLIMLLLGLAMIGFANNGLNGVLYNVGFGLVGVVVGRALRKKQS